MTTLLLGDCLKVMATLPDRSVDCFVCDLPYGQLNLNAVSIANPANNHRGSYAPTERKACDWDIKIDLVEFWKQVRRLAKDDHSPVLMFCNTKFGNELINSNPKWFRHDLVWDKGHGVSFLLANKMPMKSHEMVYVFSKAGAYYNRIDVKTDKIVYRNDGKRTGPLQTQRQYGAKKVFGDVGLPTDERCPLSVIRSNITKSRGGHPTEKPMELYEWLLSRYCPKDGLVLDPTAGSFNSILVAKKLGFKAIGIEKDNGFFCKGVNKLLHL